MSEQTSPSLAPEPFLRTFRALVEAYQVVMLTASREIERLGLTVPQYDVIATLGDTPGMTTMELAEQSLITRGTLTGVLDRLEAKGLISRKRGDKDARQIYIKLTAEGEDLFNRIFQPHVDYMGTYFNQIPLYRQQMLTELLRELKGVFPSD